jgi:hypothetical protein
MKNIPLPELPVICEINDKDQEKNVVAFLQINISRIHRAHNKFLILLQGLGFSSY